MKIWLNLISATELQNDKVPPMNNTTQINYSTEDTYLIEIVDKYWRITDEIKYAYPYADLAESYGISKYEMGQKISGKHTIQLFCGDCGVNIGEYGKRSEFKLVEYEKIGKIICEDCHQNQRNKKKKVKFEEMEAALKFKPWKGLDNEHLEILLTIVNSKNKKEVFDKVFKGTRNMRTPFGKAQWDKIGAMQDKNLLWVERGANNSVINFHVHGDLIEKLKEAYPKLINSDFDSIQFIMSKQEIRFEESYPSYTGIVNFDDVLTISGQYKCSLWRLDDGKVNVKLEPIKEEDSIFDENDSFEPNFTTTTTTTTTTNNNNNNITRPSEMNDDF